MGVLFNTLNKSPPGRSSMPLEGQFLCCALSVLAIALYKNFPQKPRHGPCTTQNAMVEFNIGHQLSRLLDFPFKNFVPHTARPSLFYAHALALIKKYKLTSEQIDKSSLRQLHRLLTPTPRPHFVNRQMWHSIHSTVFTNTLRTFNYRSIFEILPLLTKNTHHTWNPDLHAAFAENYQKSHHTPFFHAAKLHRFGILLNPS